MSTKAIQNFMGLLTCLLFTFVLLPSINAADEADKKDAPAEASEKEHSPEEKAESKETDADSKEDAHDHAEEGHAESEPKEDAHSEHGDDHQADSHGGHGGHGHGGDGNHTEISTNPLEFKADLAIWSFVVFVLLFILLGKFAWGPIANVLDEREKGIEYKLAEAARANEEAKSLLAEHEKKLAAAAEEVREIMEEARRDAETTHNDIIAKAEAEAEAREARAERKIETATAVALKELAERSANMAVDLATKAMQDNKGSIDHDRLIEQALAMLPSNESPENN
jgi:F-type H+-transporting ATPase subunit b